MSYPGSYERVTDRLVTVPTGAIGASGSRSARKKEHCWSWEKKWDTAQVPAALLGFGDEILDVGNRGRAIVPPKARLKIDKADANARRLEVLNLGVPAFAYKRQEDDCSIYLADLPVENLVLVYSFVARSNDRMQSEHGWNGAVHDCLLRLAFPPGRLAGVQDW